MQGLCEGYAFSSKGFVVASASFDGILNWQSAHALEGPLDSTHSYRFGKCADEKRADLESERHGCRRLRSSGLVVGVWDGGRLQC